MTKQEQYPHYPLVHRLIANQLRNNGIYEWTPEAEDAVKGMAAFYLAEHHNDVPVGSDAYQNTVEEWLAMGAEALEMDEKPVVVKHFFGVLACLMEDNPFLDEQDWDFATKLQWTYEQLLGLEMLDSQFGAHVIELVETGFGAFQCLVQKDINHTNAIMKETTNVH